MSRVVVLGGHGFFGAAAVELLRQRGVAPVTPTHQEADADSVEALRCHLRQGDIVLDTAGPFHDRTLALIDAAIDVGADVVDVNDSLDYALAVAALQGRIGAAGIRVLNCCSSVSAVTAVIVTLSGVADPRRVSVCLAPASRETSTRGTAASVLRSVGRPSRRLRGGRLVTARGWSEHREFRVPWDRGRVRGYLTESADAVTLPVCWPGLTEVDFWVDAHAPAINPLLRGLSLVPGGGAGLEPLAPLGVWMARRLGSRAGGVAVEVTGAGGEVRRGSLTADRQSYLVAVLPAVIAITSMLEGRTPAAGLVPVDRHVDADGLIGGLRSVGVRVAVGQG